MRIGLSYDLKDSVIGTSTVVDALEEYDSAETIDIIDTSLRTAGNETVRLGGGRVLAEKLLDDTNVDIVFNIAEGRGTYRSREAQVPSLLEMLEIPYTGSDPMTLSVCLDKPMTKRLVQLEGIETPRWILIKDESSVKNVDWRTVRFPAIVKPAFEGSSKGIHATALVYSEKEAISETEKQLHDYRQPILIEEFIDGDEITVGIVGNVDPKVIGIMRVLPRFHAEHFVYSLEVKRDWEALVDYECPAKLPAGTIERITKSSLKAFETLGCRDFSRVDFRIDKAGTPYFIEINPLPGLGSYSDLIIMATKLGWSHESVIRTVLTAALERYPKLVCA